MDLQDFIVNRDQHMRPLEYDLSENFNELLRYLNDIGVLGNVPVGVTSESGIVSISDAYPAPPRALTVFGKSTQTGTPTPDAPVPILSVDALTLLLGEIVTFYDSDSDWRQGTIKVDGDTSASSTRIRSVVIPVSAGASYSIRVNDGFLVGTRGYTEDTATSSSYVTDDFHDFAQSYVWNSTTSTYLRLLVKRTDDSRLTPSVAAAVGAVISPTEITAIPITLDGTSLRSLPDGTRDQLNFAYLRPSMREGWSVYQNTLTSLVGMTTTAATDGITGTVGVDVMSTTGEISDGPTVLYKLATPVTTQLDPIELPKLPAPNCTVWCDGGSATPTMLLEYVRDTNAAVAELSEAIADIISG